MKAIVNETYGPPEVLRLAERPDPTPGEGEVLVRVAAAAANPLDWHFLRGTPLFMRLTYGLRRPKHTVLGVDVAGRVVAVGPAVTRFSVGDEVVGNLFTSGLGGFAELAVGAEEAFAPKPAGVSFQQAAAVPTAALTALHGLRKGGLGAGQEVLVNGASGGVGTFAVQLAKAEGATVTGVCSTRNLELVRSLGADRVIDYTTEDPTRGGRRYDLVLDAVGNLSVRDLQGMLASGGRGVVVGFTSVPRMLGMALRGPRASRGADVEIGPLGTWRPDGRDLEGVLDRIAAGELEPVIDRTYPLSETAEAIRYLETGRARGKVIVVVDGGEAVGGEPGS